jgi:hypothetical protein
MSGYDESDATASRRDVLAGPLFAMHVCMSSSENHHSLGTLVSSHPGSLQAYVTWWSCAALFGVVGVMGLIRSGTNASLLKIPLILGIVLLLLSWPFRQWKQRLDIYQHGFIWRRFPFAPMVVARGDVKSVRYETFRSRLSAAQIVFVELGRRTLRINGLHDPASVKQLLATFTAPPPAKAIVGGWQPPVSKG